MRTIRNIITGVLWSTICVCCGEPFGSACDQYCKLADCPDGCYDPRFA